MKRKKIKNIKEILETYVVAGLKMWKVEVEYTDGSQGTVTMPEPMADQDGM